MTDSLGQMKDTIDQLVIEDGPSEENEEHEAPQFTWLADHMTAVTRLTRQYGMEVRARNMQLDHQAIWSA